MGENPLVGFALGLEAVSCMMAWGGLCPKWLPLLPGRRGRGPLSPQFIPSLPRQEA